MRGPTGRFVKHYVEMLVAMFTGMFALGLPVAALGWDINPIELELLYMAFIMSVPMVAWMRYRGHGWAPAGEMTAAMFVPNLAAIGLLWAGTVEGGHAPMMIQHVAMFPAMLAVMLLRRSEYTGHAGRAHATA